MTAEPEGNDSKAESGPDPDSLRSQLPEFDGDLEAARRLRTEGKHTLDQQLTALNDINSKASAILRLNILLLGLLLTAISLASEDGLVSIGDLHNGYSILGIAFLLTSTALAALTYTTSDTEAGVDSQTILDAIHEDLSETEVEIGMAEGYAYWIDFNDQTNAVNSLLISLTLMTVVISIAHFSLGVHAAVGDTPTYVLAVVFWALLLLWAVSAGLQQQFVRVLDW